MISFFPGLEIIPSSLNTKWNRAMNNSQNWDRKQGFNLRNHSCRPVIFLVSQSYDINCSGVYNRNLLCIRSTVIPHNSTSPMQDNRPCVMAWLNYSWFRVVLKWCMRTCRRKNKYYCTHCMFSFSFSIKLICVQWGRLKGKALNSLNQQHHVETFLSFLFVAMSH